MTEYSPLYNLEFNCKKVPKDKISICVGNKCDLCPSKKGLTINTKQFCTTVTDRSVAPLDHLKFFAAINKEFCLVDCLGEFIVETCLACEQSFSTPAFPSVYAERIRNIYTDPRLCSTGFGIIDEKSGLSFMTVVTDEAVYAYYERRPSSKCNANAAAFTSLVQIATKSRCEFQRLAIGIEKESGYVKWYVGKNEVFKITNIGSRLGDQYQVADYGCVNSPACVKNLKIVFGNFSFLDFQLPNNYSRDYTEEVVINNILTFRSESGLLQLANDGFYYEIIPNQYGQHILVDPTLSFASSNWDDVSLRLFGQGIVSIFKYIRAYTKNQVTKIVKDCKVSDVVKSNCSSCGSSSSDCGCSDKCNSCGSSSSSCSCKKSNKCSTSSSSPNLSFLDKDKCKKKKKNKKCCESTDVCSSSSSSCSSSSSSCSDFSSDSFTNFYCGKCN